MEHQFKPFDKIIVRDSEEETWMCDFFSHYEKDVTYKYVGISDAHKDCLPYEGNEHLVGTYDNPTPPEPEFKFGDKVEVLHFGKWVHGIFINKREDKYPYRVTLEEEIESIFYFKECRHADW